METFIRKIRCLIALLTMTVGFQAVAETHCVCQVGLEPAVQRPLFKIGCQMWLNQQINCDSKQIVDFPTDSLKRLNIVLPDTAYGGTLNLGYVGHWESTNQSLRHIYSGIMPLMKKHDLDVIVDNTACKGASDPQNMADVAVNFGILFRDVKKLTYKANQVTSIGLWDQLPGMQSVNIPVSVDMHSGQVQYPSCEPYHQKTCIGSVQAYQSATCSLGRNSKLLMKCCPQKKAEYLDQAATIDWRWMPDLHTSCAPQ